MLTVIANELRVECLDVDTAAQFVRCYMDLSGEPGERPSIQCNLRIEGGRQVARPRVVDVPRLEAPQKPAKPKRGRGLEGTNRRELRQQRLDQIAAFLRTNGPAKKVDIAREFGLHPTAMTGYSKDRRFKVLPDKRLALAGDSRSTGTQPASKPKPKNQQCDMPTLTRQIQVLLKADQPQSAADIARKLAAQTSQVVRALGDESTFELIDGLYWLV